MYISWLSRWREWRGAACAACMALLLAACGGGDSEQAAAPTAQGAATALRVQAASSDGRVTDLQADTDGSQRAAHGPRIGNDLYIIQLADKPAAAYDGNVPGLAATRPRKGHKFDPDAPAVAAYLRHLTAKQDAVLGTVGRPKKEHSYGYVFNGFAAVLTAAQARQLAGTPGVVAITKDEILPLATSSTPGFLGLSGPAGVWSTTGATGEDVIVGVIDGGIWPEHPSFSDRAGSRVLYRPVRDWRGTCATGQDFTAAACNRKLVGARFYNAGFGGDAGVTARFPGEYNSPRDFDGHGTHTSSTAAGNSGVLPTGDAAAFGAISGMAPRARIAMYKVCWGGQLGGCATSDAVAAIEQAVADGVDVINYSIGGSTSSFVHPVEIAFMHAADAGVFIAAAAGNSGPAADTVSHLGPWVTTVGAGTHNRSGRGSITLGNGSTYAGASFATAAGPAPFIDAAAAGLSGADAAQAALCFAAEDNNGSPVLDPALVAGKIILCDRGTTPRVNKSLAAKEAGALGMVLVNTSDNTLNADLHSVPTVHLPQADRDALKAYAATSGATATINRSTIDLSTPAPFVASFSSRGPVSAAGGNLLKPDLVAPGQDVLAGVAPPADRGRLFQVMSGTSMSAPHVAGIAAVLRQLHPAWSPMALKSALMTTATDVLDGPGTSASVIFRQGAGHVRPLQASNPGLVFDSNITDWMGFLCGTQLAAAQCATHNIPVLDPVQLNVASIAIGELTGPRTVTRRVTNVGGASATYTPSWSGMEGVSVKVSPASLTLAAGQTKSFTVALTPTSAAPEGHTAGQLTWSDGRHSVRIPMVVRPVPLTAPAQATGAFDVRFGYTGPFSAGVRGLVPAATAILTVPNGGFVDLPVTIPAGMTYVRFALFDTDVQPPADLDLQVFLHSTVVGSSTRGLTANEEVNLVNPEPGIYTVRVYATTNAASSVDVRGYGWFLDSGDAGNMVVSAPQSATAGQTGTIRFSTSGLLPGTRYLGAITYGGLAASPDPTIIRVDN